MASSFVFYDLETSGFNARRDRIMQFAAIRTDLNLQPIGEPYNFLVKLADDVLPSPQAIKLTAITPQKTLAEGYTEAEATRLIMEEVFTLNSVVVGFNNIRFDDEFIRHLCWRNFYDPYQWAYKDGRSRWDLLDVVRFYRAMRPDGIEWPVDELGRPVNKLEVLTKANHLEHDQAHDALSDVRGLIAVAQLLRGVDAKLWQYLFELRDKYRVRQLVNLEQPQAFVYTSGRLESNFNKTTLAYPICCGNNNNNIIIYNLRHDPQEFLGLSVSELATHLSNKFSKLTELAKTDQSVERPVYFKELKYNQCPAVAPMVSLRKSDYQRLQLNKTQILTNIQVLKDHPELAQNISRLYQLHQEQITAQSQSRNSLPAEARLYEAFLSPADQAQACQIRQAEIQVLSKLQPKFIDKRLPELFINYKARSFPNTLSPAEEEKWETYRVQILQEQLENFWSELQTLAASADSNDQYYAEELRLWLESLAPSKN